MNTYSEHFDYSWGYWCGLNPQLRTIRYYSNWNAAWWQGYVSGRVDYFLKQKGLK